MIVDDTVLLMVFGCGMVLFWFASIEYLEWRERRQSTAQQTPEIIEVIQDQAGVK